MPTLYLILSHLLADFTLQPTKLLKWKMKSWKGTFIHCLIFYGITLLFLFPYLGKVEAWAILTLLSFSHFILDEIKIKLQESIGHYQTLFIIDQCFHVLFLFVAGYGIKWLSIELPKTYFYEKLYQNIELIAYASIIVFLTFTYDLIRYLANNRFHPLIPYKPDYHGFTRRVLVFIALYFSFLLYLRAIID